MRSYQNDLLTTKAFPKVSKWTAKCFLAGRYFLLNTVNHVHYHPKGLNRVSRKNQDCLIYRNNEMLKLLVFFREELYFRETSWAHWGKCEKWAEHGCGSLLFNCSFRSHSFRGKADMNTSHPKRVRASVGAKKKITWAAQRLSKMELIQELY